MATCHTDRRHQAKGLCLDCYNRHQRQNHQKWQKIRWEFGLTKEQYEELLARQGGVCAICRKPETRRYKRAADATVKALAVDHCHDTETVRGLLCHNCNLGIGHLADDPALIIRAALYLVGCIQPTIQPAAKFRRQT